MFHFNHINKVPCIVTNAGLAKLEKHSHGFLYQEHLSSLYHCLMDVSPEKWRPAGRIHLVIILVLVLVEQYLHSSLSFVEASGDVSMYFSSSSS